MNRIQCPFCGEPHNYRDSSGGNLTRCVTCGNRYRLPAMQNSAKSAIHTCLGCLVLLAFGGCLLAFMKIGLHREAHETTQDSEFKEQKREAQEITREEEDRKGENSVENKRRAETETRRKSKQEAKEEAERRVSFKADEERIARAEAEQEIARKAELEKKGLPHYPRPGTVHAGHNAEEWYHLLRDNPRSARIYAQATAALLALKEEAIPFLLDYLNHQTTLKSRQEALRLIQVEYVHRNDLHKLLFCLEQTKNDPFTRLLALKGLEKRAKDLKKELIPQIENLVKDMLDNPRYSEKTKEEIRSRLKTIRMEADAPSANRRR